MNQIDKYLIGKDEEILLDIKQLVEKESPTLRKELVDECGQEVKRLFRDYLEIDPYIFEDDIYGDHLLYEYGNHQSKDQIFISGHYDTVWDEGDLQYQVEGNKAYGPGILDMKGGLVIALWALKAIKDLDIQLKKKIVFLCNSDHEGVASPHSREIIEREAKKSEAVLIPEAATACSNALKTERKGILRYKIKAKGRAAHAGNNPEDGVNAIVEIAKHIQRLDSLNDNNYGTTINVGKVHGGTGINVVADEVVIEVDVRVKTMDEAKRIKGIIESFVPYHSDATLEVNGGIVRPSMEKTDKTLELFAIAKKIGEEINYDVKEASVGGGSDGSFAAALNIPTLDGLGAAGIGPHAKNEHILIDHLSKKAALLANIIIKIDRLSK